MGSNLVTFTLLRYGILTSLVVAGVLIIMSVSRQDWMREEVSMKLAPLLKIATNISAAAQPAMVQQLDALKMIPGDATVDVMAHFGLRKTRCTITVSGLPNPAQLTVPEVAWILNNDVFTDPSKYGVPPTFRTSLKMMEDEAEALKTAYIFMALALLFVVISVILVVLKAFKYPTKLILATFICCLLSCICIITALGIVHSKFDFKTSFNQAKSFVKRQQSGGIQNMDGAFSRQRRDDGSPGYSGHYTTDSTMGNSGGGYGMESGSVAPSESDGMTPSGAQMGMVYGELAAVMMMDTELKESIGSPLVYAGLACGTIIFVVLLSVVEFVLIRRSSEGDDVKYQNVALT